MSASFRSSTISRGFSRMTGAFSLLELLVATAVFLGLALILLSIAGSLSSFWQIGISHNERRSSVLAAFSRMARDLRFAPRRSIRHRPIFSLSSTRRMSARTTSFPKPPFGRRRWPRPLARRSGAGRLFRPVGRPIRQRLGPKLCRLLSTRRIFSFRSLRTGLTTP